MSIMNRQIESRGFMTISKSLLRKAHDAGARLTDAQRQAEIAREDYHSIVRRMHLAGGSLREIAEALDLSHQRVQQMVGKAGGSWWQQVWRSRNAKRNLACTFCTRAQEVVDKLIAGPNVFICDVCVARVERCLVGAVPSEGVALASEDSRVRSSFCLKRRGAVGSVVSGSRASICNLCINVCRQILTDTSE